jgi:hypothetical protein
MEISGQYHTLAALTPGKGFQVPIGEEAMWTPVPVWRLVERRKSLDPAGNQTPAVKHSPRRYLQSYRTLHPVLIVMNAWSFTSTE